MSEGVNIYTINNTLFSFRILILLSKNLSEILTFAIAIGSKMYKNNKVKSIKTIRIIQL